VAALVQGVAQNCPGALINIITNPVNSTVPIAAEVLKAAGVFDPAKLMGVTSLDVVRSNTFVSKMKELDMKFTDVPVIGGHSGVTILPLLSKVSAIELAVSSLSLGMHVTKLVGLPHSLQKDCCLLLSCWPQPFFAGIHDKKRTGYAV
jgi:malate dehydrogenase